MNRHWRSVTALGVSLVVVSLAWPVSAQTARDLRCSGCVGNKDVAKNAVTSRNIKDSSVTGSDVKNSSLTGADIKNSSITGSDIKSNTIQSSDIKDGTITGTDIKSGTIQGSDIKNGSITSSDLKDGTITGSDIKDGAISLQHLDDSVKSDLGLPPSLGGFGQTKATSEALADRNVNLLRREDESGFTYYNLRMVFEGTDYEISREGVPTKFENYKISVSVTIDDSGELDRLSTYTTAWADADPNTYHVEEASYDVDTLDRTVTQDIEYATWICGNAYGSVIHLCLETTYSILDDSIIQTMSFPRMQALYPSITRNGLTFAETRAEMTWNDSIRIRAKGIGRVVLADTRGRTAMATMYYRINGSAHGTLAGTPFEPGVGLLDGMFFE